MTKRPSFFFTFFLSSVFVVALIIVVSFGFSYVYLSAEYRGRDVSHYQELLGVVGQYFQRDWPEESSGEVDRQCKTLMAGQTVRLTVIAKDGRALGDSRDDPGGMQNQASADQPEVLAALDGQVGQHTRHDQRQGRRHTFMALPVRRNGDIVGAVRLAVPVKALSEDQKFMWQALRWVIFAAVIADIVLVVLIAWLWSRPLRQISAAARKIAGGDLQARAELSGPQELVELSNALNEMRRNLADQFAASRAQRERLQTVLTNLREGVIALDSDMRVVLINQAALDMLAPGARDPVGQPIQSLVRIPAILDVLHELAEGVTADKELDVQFQTQALTLELHVSQLEEPSSQGITMLLVVRDITELARTDSMKAAFVANASHELRTPLATVRAAVDSLLAAEPDDQQAVQKFSGMLDRHVARLEETTKDLLDLHILEQGTERLRLETIELGSLGQWCRRRFATLAAEKGLTFDVEINDPDYAFESDRTLVELVVQNLIDNAIKYTPEGGRVDVYIEPRGEEAVFLRVRDTGQGIPVEVQDRIFERFFQVDSARSGDSRARGSGLGLAIVKFAAERLGAKISLQSTPGEGTAVSVLLPTGTGG